MLLKSLLCFVKQCSFLIFCYHNCLIFLAGTPPYKVLEQQLLITTAPAAITTPSPISTPGSIVALAPIQQPFPIMIGFLSEIPAL